MPRDAYDPEPHRGRSLAALRVAGFVCGVGLAVVAVWLIVTGTTQKRIELGVLAGLWGLLLAAFAVFGSRRPRLIDYDPEPGGELELRVRGEVEREDDAAARRHYEARLEHMLRREIQTTMARELAALRGEVASLRTELLDKVGGQLRLERIETTRVIGSDIEALQREISQLKTVRQLSAVDQPARPMTRLANAIVVEPAERVAPPRTDPPVTVPPVAVPVPEPVAEHVVAASVPEPVAEPVAEFTTVPVPVPAPDAAEAERVADSAPLAASAQPPMAPEQPLLVPEAGPAPLGNDPFAELPRLQPFTISDADLGQPAGTAGAPVNGARPEAPAVIASGARHADRDGTSGRAGSRSGGGRRRREAGSDNDVLAQILQREGVRR